MENIIELTRPLMQGYILLFIIMLLALYVIFLPYCTAKKMKEEREAEQIEEIIKLKYKDRK